MLAKYVAAEGQQFERIYDYFYGIPSATVLEWNFLKMSYKLRKLFYV
jgi:hypothetical protein